VTHLIIVVRIEAEQVQLCNVVEEENKSMLGGVRILSAGRWQKPPIEKATVEVLASYIHTLYGSNSDHIWLASIMFIIHTCLFVVRSPVE
jgi:hypothetical protein